MTTNIDITNLTLAIPLTQGQFAIVSGADYLELSKYKWSAHYAPRTKSFYAVRGLRDPATRKTRTFQMHRQVLGLSDPKIQADHINHNTLDNRRENLRAVTPRENTSNKKGKATGKYSSEYVGVCWDKNREKWLASILLDGKVRNLGRFENELDASKAYQAALEASKLGF